jgi:hypothetical protein
MPIESSSTDRNTGSMLIFNEALNDNDLRFLHSVDTALKYSDPEVKVECRRSLNTLIVTVIPSQEEFKQDIIDNLVGLHRMMGMKITFTKSLGLSKQITFQINLEN